MDWKIKFIPSAVKDISALPKRDALRLKRHLETFLEGLNEHDMAYLAISKAKKLRGKFRGLYRLRKGKYRIIFSMNEALKTIKVIHVGKRENIYG